MEQVCSVPFSALVATLLLNNRVVTARDIVNFNSKISSLDGNIIVDVIDDDIDCLSLCVNFDSKFNFSIKPGLDYDSIIDDELTVRQFLLKICLPDEIMKLVFGNVNKEVSFSDDFNVNANTNANTNTNNNFNATNKRKIKLPLIFKRV